MALAKSSFLFATGTLLSRISGLARDAVFVSVLGASQLHDAFLIAFRIPNLFREMFAEGALGSSFTTIFSELWAKNPKRAKRLLVDSIYFFILLLTFFCGLGIILAPELVRLMTAMNHSPVDSVFFRNTVVLTRLMFPYLMLTVIGSIVMGALHQRGRFFLSAVSPIAFNFGNITGALALAPLLVNWFHNDPLASDPTVLGIGLGVLLGGLLQLGWQLWGIWAWALRGYAFKLYKLPWGDDLKRVLRVMLPAALAASTGPVNIFVNTNFATRVGPGAVTWLNYAFRLLQLPIGVFGVAVSSAVLPQLARALSGANSGELSKAATIEFENAVELVLWLIIPCTIFLAVENQAIIHVIFKQGRFGDSDVQETSRALLGYSFGLIGYSLIKVLTTLYFALGRTKVAMKVAIVCMVVNYLSNEFLVEKYGHVGLAITSSIVLTLNAGILMIGSLKHYKPSSPKRILRSLLYISLASGSSLLILFFFRPLSGILLPLTQPKLLALIEMFAVGTVIGISFSMVGLLRWNLSPKQIVVTLNKKFRERTSRTNN